GELDERGGEHAERERDDDRERDHGGLPGGRCRQARARGGAAAQAPLLLGRERRAAQRTRLVRGRRSCGGCWSDGGSGDAHAPAPGGRTITVGWSWSVGCAGGAPGAGAGRSI